MTSTDRSTTPERSSTFVLLPGAWSGPWAWEPVHTRLARRGHRVHAVAFSGLQPEGEEEVDAVTLQTHVDDTLALIARHDLVDVVLVGHSYSGLVAGMVTDQAPRRIVRTVYVEGLLAGDGESLLDAFGAEQKVREVEDIRANDGWWPPPWPQRSLRSLTSPAARSSGWPPGWRRTRHGRSRSRSSCPTASPISPPPSSPARILSPTSRGFGSSTAGTCVTSMPATGRC